MNFGDDYIEVNPYKYDAEMPKEQPKYRLIDILNKIANGELKEGTKIKRGNTNYMWDNRDCFFYDEEDNFICLDPMKCLSDEVELIEPQEPTDNTKIEELKYVLEELQNPTYNESWLMNCIRANRDKLNEVISVLNKRS